MEVGQQVDVEKKVENRIHPARTTSQTGVNEDYYYYYYSHIGRLNAKVGYYSWSQRSWASSTTRKRTGRERKKENNSSSNIITELNGHFSCYEHTHTRIFIFSSYSINSKEFFARLLFV